MNHISVIRDPNYCKMDHYLTEWIRMFTIKRRRKKYTLVSIWPVLLCTVLAFLTGVRAQCFGGIETYEKTAGVNFASVSNLQGLVSQPGTAVTRDCAALCRQTANCAAFAVDYATSRCQSIDADGIKKREHLRDAPGVNYFEKMCLRRISNFNAVCGDRQWAFERVLGATLQGFDDMEQTGIQSRGDCQRLCLEQTNFICRSAEFDEAAQICRLSREDRRTQPSAFRKDGSSWDYLENQCVRTLPDCRYTPRSDGILTISMDQVEFAQSQGECESLCDQARVFTCRAYSFTAEENRCYLSGDDSISHPTNSFPQTDAPSSTPAATLTGGKKLGTVFAEKICSVSHCENGIFTFEKVTGHFLRSARQEMLNRAKGTSPSSTRIITTTSGGSTTALSADSISGGITVDCGRLCLEMGSDCPAYSVDYAQGRCFKLDRNSQGRAQELTIREGMSYFEKICLRGSVGPCRDRAWAFERHPSKELRLGGSAAAATEERVIPMVATRKDCQEACLRESRFSCRSARYDTMSLECKLSSTDKRLRPEAFFDAPSQIEYLENQCVTTGSGMCAYQTIPDAYPRYLDALVSNISDDNGCQQLCSGNRAFSCRSYSFYASGSQCFLSSDDRVSAGPTAMQSRPGTNYTERSCRSSLPRNDSSFNPGSQSSEELFPGGFVTPVTPNKPEMMRPSQPTIAPSFNTFPGSTSNSGSSGDDRNFQPPFNNFDPPGGEKTSNSNPPPRNPSRSKCRLGRPHYQRVAGYEAVPSRFITLRPPPPVATGSSVINHSGALMDCLEKCSSDSLCYGVNFMPIKQSCIAVESDQESMDMSTALLFTLPRNLSETLVLRPNAAIGYFESQCFQAPGCESTWSTERTPGYFMRGVEREILPGLTRSQCTERCLEERRFICRSASYDTSRQECHLSAEDRYTRPRAYQSNPIYDYIENQCSSGSNSETRQCRYGPVQSDRFLLYADRIISGVSGSTSCQAACDSERNFRCRSYSIHSTAAVPSSSPGASMMYCSLSSSTTPTYEFQRGALAAERDCLPLSTNEIPLPLETAHLGFNDRRVMTSGTASGNVPAADPGGWVSLASLSRTQQVSGNRKMYPPNEPLNRPGYEGYRPGSEGNYRPGMDSFRPPQDGYRRPIADVTPFDMGYQYNTVGVSNRPLFPTDAIVPGLVDSNVLRCRGSLSYDKVANADFVGARRQEIRLSPDGSPTLECLRECDRLRERCLSVVMSTDGPHSSSVAGGDFNRYGNWSSSSSGNSPPRLRCYILDRAAAMDSASLPYTPNSIYFEKTCLPEATCGKPWSFVRVHGYELEGFDGQVARSVASKEECQSACLRMTPTSTTGTATLCRSAEYLPRERICRMSSDNRRTQLRSFKASAPDVIYMENQCASDPPHCEYSDQSGRVSPWYDRSVSLVSIESSATSGLAECRRMCDTERDFLCKSVSFQMRSSRSPLCLLSSDDSVSLNGANAANSLMPDRDFTYSERSSCSNVRVECTKTDMLITLSFGYPFNGRVYANGNYQACFEAGNGQNQLLMRIPLVGPCGTVQATRGRYVNNIIVQHNPQIMQDTDSTVRVECAFEASEQTISYASGGGRQGGTGGNGLEFMGGGSIDVTSPVRHLGHSVVTNTAPTPALRMRILSRSGQESRVVGLGELLTLKIEVDPTSAFGIMARNVEARTDNGEVLTLIDATGCPRDGNIFPPLEVDPNSKSISADFKAFRFPSTATVNFIATVGFCQDRCEPARCPDGWESYGRRRREVNETDLVTEPEVEEIVIINGTTPEHPLPTTTTIGTTVDQTSASAETATSAESVSSTRPVDTTDSLPQDYEVPSTIMIEPEESEGEEEESDTSQEKESETNNNIIPYEVPLHLQLIVAPEADRKSASAVPPASHPQPAALPSTSGRSSAYNELPTQGPPYWRPAPSNPYEEQSDFPVCTSRSTVISISIVAVLLHILLLVAFYVFYRTKRARWAKLAGHQEIMSSRGSIGLDPGGGLRHSGSVSEVTFRSVYGQRSGPGTLTKAFHLDSMSSNPRVPHVASVFDS